jgi:hypothetical protein
VNKFLSAAAALIGMAAILATSGTARAGGAAPTPIAVFDFTLIDTSPAPPSAAELARLKALDDQLRERLAQSGRYRVLETASLREKLAKQPDIMRCNGCELPLAQGLGARELAYGWVQKVSDLILNINLVIEDVSSGQKRAAGSVDIRGNTDESWRRGLDYLLEERILTATP